MGAENNPTVTFNYFSLIECGWLVERYHEKPWSVPGYSLVITLVITWLLREAFKATHTGNQDVFNTTVLPLRNLVGSE